MARRAHFWSLIVVIAVAPAPLGSNRPLAWNLLALAIGLLCLTFPLTVPRDRIGQVVSLRALAIPLIGFGFAVAWAAAQSIPGLWSSAADPLWTMAQQALASAGGPGVRQSLSIDREATRIGLVRLLTDGGIFWLFLQHGHLSRRPYQTVDALAVVAIVYALYGLAEFVSGTETILGMAKWAYIGDLTSTFVNRNSYATFAGLGLLCCIAATARRLGSRRPGWTSLLLHLQRPTAGYALGIFAVGLALANTGSRAGTASTAVALITLALLMLAAGGKIARRRAAILLAGWSALVAGGAAWVLLGSRIFSVGAFDRAIVYRLTLGAIADRPLLGTGLGTFPAVFERLRPATLVLPWREAHDTYLELMLELGIPATLCLLAPIVWSVGRSLTSIMARDDHDHAISLGVAATTLVAVHSLIDFSAQMPAVTAYWLAILATGVARTRLKARGAERIAFGLGQAM